MNKQTFLVLGLAAALAGCGKKKDDAGGATPTATVDEKADKAAAKAGVGGNLPDPIAAWMPKDAKAALAGSWLLSMNIAKGGSVSLGGDKVAVKIDGDKAEVFDGKDTHHMPWYLASPCKISFTEETDGPMGHATYEYSMEFLVANGQVQIARSAAGMRKGKSAIVCSETGESNVYLVDDKGACTGWSFRFGKWESKPETCAWSQEDGKDVLKVGTGDWAPKLVADGDLLKSEQFVSETKTPAKMDWEAAKAAATDDMHQHDPAWKAQQKGGKPGDLTTVLGITASVGDASIFGKETTVNAQYYSSNSSTSNGKTTYFLSLVDSKDSTDITLACELAAEAPTMKQFDKVTVKGTIAKSFGASLENCSIVPAK